MLHLRWFTALLLSRIAKYLLFWLPLDARRLDSEGAGDVFSCSLCAVIEDEQVCLVTDTSGSGWGLFSGYRADVQRYDILPDYNRLSSGRNDP